jgi:hypothetical protein
MNARFSFFQAFTEFSVSLLRNSADITVASAFDFVNRDHEILQLAGYLLKNIANSRTETFNTSQYRMTVPTSPQMFGAGKTALGVNFLSALRKRQHLLDNLFERFKTIDINHLLKLKHVLVDLRNIETLSDVGAVLFKSVLNVEGLTTASEMPANLRGLHSGSPLFQIVGQCEAHFGCLYFLQFDDVPESVSPSKLLKELHQIHDQRPALTSQVFVSSRSPTLYLLGFAKTFTSPSNTAAIVVDSLNEEHVLELLKLRLEMVVSDEFPGMVVSDELKRGVAARIHYLTAGVPRFVVGALDMLYTGTDLKWHPVANWLTILETQSVLNNLENTFHRELYEWDTLLKDETSRSGAIEMLRLAALAVPFKLNESVKAAWFGIQQAEKDTVPLMFCSLFPLYVDRLQLKHDNHELFRFVVPRVCLLVLQPGYNLRLPFHVMSEGVNVATMLEVTARNCMRLRVSDVFVSSRNQTFGALLPFFAESLIAHVQPTFLGGKAGYGTFPKIVNDDTNLEIDVLKKLMCACAMDEEVSSVVGRNQLDAVLRLMSPDYLAMPAPMSASADLLYLSPGRNMLELQLKSGDQKVTPSLLIDELVKSCYSLIGNGTDGTLVSVTFVMVCLNGLSTQFLKQFDNKPQPEVIDGMLAYRFGPKTEFVCTRKVESMQLASFTVPTAMDVIILLDEGLKLFLTETNIRSLRNFGIGIKDAHLAMSPRKPTGKVAVDDMPVVSVFESFGLVDAPPSNPDLSAASSSSTSASSSSSSLSSHTDFNTRFHH